jgi:hypothetical protein
LKVRLFESRRQNFRVHDIRRTVSTNLAKLGIEQNINSRILNHVAKQTNGERLDAVAAVYNRALFAKEKRCGAIDTDGLLPPTSSGLEVYRRAAIERSHSML